ncbi:MAG: hypothetical protein GTO63_32990, partial [Anaerolineae bacterium]|nr:hypothetical protein [Anaerolineae bacterium]NIN99467.1 hypothetical protein [Anaerolineae bacterium]NIQ82332.1 hypothetical protein [Anaerolineae bacterium]
LPPRFTWLRDPFDTLVSLYALWVSVWDRRPILYETCDKDKYQDFPSFVEGNLSGASRYLGTDPAALDHFTFVGIAERSQACYTALCKQLGIQSSQLPRTNAAPRPPDVDYDLREVHRELHPVEYEIYDYALRTWQEKW